MAYRGRGLFLERLEARLLLSFDPTPFEQEMIEHLNRMRTNPQGELAVLFTSLNPLLARDPDADAAVQYFNDPTAAELEAEWSVLAPVQPVAWHESLYYAALGHSQEMLRRDAQSHQFPGEPALGDRAAGAGYADWTRLGENVFAFAQSPFHAHSAFAIDWSVPDRGHRGNMMDPDYWEIGIGLATDSSTTNRVGPLLVTQDFGDRSSLSGPYLLGAVFDDLNHNGWYEAGEGLGQVSIEITGSGGTFTTTTMSAGGYQVQVPEGTYSVTASGGALNGPLSVEGVVVTSQNVKVDFVDGPPQNQAPLVDLNGPNEPGTDFQTVFYAGDGSVAAVGLGATITDPDAANLSSAIITLTSQPDGTAESLDVDTTGTQISADFDPELGILRLTGLDSPANYERAFSSLRYSNSAPTPTASPRVIEIVVSDGTANSSPASVVVNVVAGPAPSLSIGDAALAEGDSGTAMLMFTVSLSAPAGRTVTVDYSTGGGTAVAPADYQAQSGRLTFDSNQTTGTIAVPVLGDYAEDGNKDFFVTLSNSAGAGVADDQALGVIIDDDTPLVLPSTGLVELGGIDLSAGRVLYRLDKPQAGLLSVLAVLQNPDDQVRLQLKGPDRSQPAIGEILLAGQTTRVDWETPAGTYMLEASGVGSSVALRLVDLVTHEGTALTVRGTSAPDHFEFDATTARRIAIAGVAYEFTAAEVRSVVFQGDGADTADLTGSPGNDVATLRPSSGVLSGADFEVNVSGIAELTVRAGAGTTDVTHLYDSAGNDTFTADPSGGSMAASTGDRSFALGFDYLHGYSQYGGFDRAYLNDSPGADEYLGMPTYGRLMGPGFFNRAKGFDEIYVRSTTIDDQAHLYGSTGYDTFTGSPTEGVMAGSGFYHKVESFHWVHGYARGSGDVALFNDSDGGDTFIGTPVYGKLYAGNYLVRAKYFAKVQVNGSGKGFDQARFYDSSGNDTFLARRDWTEMSGPKYDNIVTNFAWVQGFSDLGGYDVAHLHDTAGNDTFTGKPLEATMATSGFTSRAVRFDEAHGYSQWGGYDVAHLYDSEADDTFTGRYNYARMVGTGYSLRAKLFDMVHAHSTAGGTDTAYLYDSAGNDSFVGSAAQSELWGEGFSNRASGFARVYAQSVLGGEDEATLNSSGDPDDTFEDGLNYTRLYNDLAPFFIEAAGFARVRKNQPDGGSG